MGQLSFFICDHLRHLWIKNASKHEKTSKVLETLKVFFSGSRLVPCLAGWLRTG